jgi:hypothetical protein
VAEPSVSHEVIVQPIGSTTIETGPEVCCEIDSDLYPKGTRVTKQEMQVITIMLHAFHCG